MFTLIALVVLIVVALISEISDIPWRQIIDGERAARINAVC